MTSPSTWRPEGPHLRLPATDALRCFAAAAHTLNFRAAARAVGLTPQAFSHRIKSLEEELGERLFDRTTRSVQLTLAGLELRALALQALSALQACAKVGERQAPAPVTFLLGTRYELGLSWLEPNLKALHAALPAVRLHLYFGSGHDIVQRVRASEVDCAVTSARLNAVELIGFPLHREDYALVAAPGALRRAPLARPGHAAHHTLVDVDESLPLFRYWRDARKEHSRFEFGDLRRMGTSEAVRRCVLRGEGVAVLPTYLIRADLQARRLVPLLPRAPLLHDFFRLVIRADDPRRAVFERLAEQLRRFPLR